MNHHNFTASDIRFFPQLTERMRFEYEGNTVTLHSTGQVLALKPDNVLAFYHDGYCGFGCMRDFNGVVPDGLTTRGTKYQDNPYPLYDCHVDFADPNAKPVLTVRK